MSRDWYINGESMVLVKSRSDSAIGSLSQLGLSADPIQITPNYRHLEMQLDAFGRQIPPDTQVMLFDVIVTVNFIHFDSALLEECQRLSVGGPPVIGQLPHAGTRLGGGVARFAVGNNLISLNIQSGVGKQPWRFLTCYLTGSPGIWPLGTEKSAVQTQWRAIPFTIDPWNGGAGALGIPIYDHVLDT